MLFNFNFLFEKIGANRINLCPQKIPIGTYNKPRMYQLYISTIHINYTYPRGPISDLCYIHPYRASMIHKQCFNEQNYHSHVKIKMRETS